MVPCGRLLLNSTSLAGLHAVRLEALEGRHLGGRNTQPGRHTTQSVTAACVILHSQPSTSDLSGTYTCSAQLVKTLRTPCMVRGPADLRVKPVHGQHQALHQTGVCLLGMKEGMPFSWDHQAITRRCGRWQQRGDASLQQIPYCRHSLHRGCRVLLALEHAVVSCTRASCIVLLRAFLAASARFFSKGIGATTNTADRSV